MRCVHTKPGRACLLQVMDTDVHFVRLLITIISLRSLNIHMTKYVNIHMKKYVNIHMKKYVNFLLDLMLLISKLLNYYIFLSIINYLVTYPGKQDVSLVHRADHLLEPCCQFHRGILWQAFLKIIEERFL